jgi:peroxiredoxin Q/BCP
MPNQLIQAITPFSLPAYPTGTFSNDLLQGQWCILYFYPKDNTPGCTQQSLAFQENIERFKTLNTQIIGISRDSLKSHINFANKFELTFTLISDVDEQLCQQFNVLKEKMNYGRTYIGIERSTFLIDPQGILRAEWRKVSVNGHIEIILETLQRLQNA